MIGLSRLTAVSRKMGKLSLTIFDWRSAVIGGLQKITHDVAEQQDLTDVSGVWDRAEK